MATKYKRGQIWWARAQRRGREFRESLKTRNSAVAERRLAKWVEDLEALAWGDRPPVTFREAMKQFMAEHLATLKPKSAKRYSVSLSWLNEKLGAMTMNEIGRAELSDFEMWRRGMKARRRVNKVSGPTIRRDLACLSSLFTFCEDKEWLEDGRNPVPGYMRRRAKRGLREAPERTRYLSIAEEAGLLEHASDGVREAITLSIDTGLREQELLSLTWPQVDFAKGTILTSMDTKSGRSRTVPMAQRSARFLAIWKAKRSTSKDGKVSYPYVFRHDDSAARFTTLHKGFKAAARRAKILDIRWHDLRRTAGCRWRQRDGVPLEEVSVLLGHSSYKVTERIYAFLENETIAESVAAQKPARRKADYSKKGR